MTAHITLYTAVLGGLLQLFAGGGGTMVGTWVVSARVTEHLTAFRPPYFALPTTYYPVALLCPSSANPFTASHPTLLSHLNLNSFNRSFNLIQS